MIISYITNIITITVRLQLSHHHHHYYHHKLTTTGIDHYKS